MYNDIEHMAMFRERHSLRRENIGTRKRERHHRGRKKTGERRSSFSRSHK